MLHLQPFIKKAKFYQQRGELQEVYFFECLFESFKPENIFIIGNAFGWSTVLMALLNPNGQVVALDAGIEGDFGIRLTNKIAEEEELSIKVVKGFSPNDVAKTVEENFSTGIDFVFIDGLHTNEQQKLDFNAVFNFCHENCVCVFHDVVNWKMMQSFQEIVAVSGLNANVLYRTPSGMGILYPDQVSIETKECIQAFSEKKGIIESLLESQTITHKSYATIIRFLPKWIINLLRRVRYVVRR